MNVETLKDSYEYHFGCMNTIISGVQICEGSD